MSRQRALSYYARQPGDPEYAFVSAEDGKGAVNAIYDDMAALEYGVVEVRAFGAVGDGVTDDTAAVQACIDAAAAAGGGVVLFPAGVYRCNVTLPQKVMLRGEGVGVSVLKAVAGSNATVVLGQDFADLTGKEYESGDIFRGARLSGIRDLTIDGDKANQSAGWGIQVWGCYLRFQDIQVQDCHDGGIWTEFTTHGAGTPDDLLESAFTNIKIVRNGGDGWRWRGPHDSTIQNLVTVSNTGWGLQGDTSEAIIMIGCNSWLNTIGSYKFVGPAQCWGCVASGEGGIGVEFGAGSGLNRFSGPIGGHETGVIAVGTQVIIDVQANGVSGTLLQLGKPGVGAGFVDARLTGTAVGTAVKKVSVDGNSRVVGTVGCTTLLDGTLGSHDSFDLRRYGTEEMVFSFPSTDVYVRGWAPKFPLSSGVILTRDGSSTTVGAAGAAAAPPANPVAWWTVKDASGNAFKIPVYNT